ncbi:MAG TPA: hypothetical protein VK149_12525 [Sideroxyarcus sp.]|nr:hypothetical protein [Sideroxyarcus sp.]
MATTPRTKVGMMPCEGQRCESHEMGRLVRVWKTDKGAMSYKCDCCGRGYYVKPEDEAYQEWLDAIIPDKVAAQEPQKVEAPAAETQAAKKKNFLGI